MGIMNAVERGHSVTHDLQVRSVPFLFYTESPEAESAHPGVHILHKPSMPTKIVQALKTVLSLNCDNVATLRMLGKANS